MLVLLDCYICYRIVSVSILAIPSGSNTWYSIHYISAGISHHYQSVQWSFTRRELHTFLIVRSRLHKDLPKISCFIRQHHKWNKRKACQPCVYTNLSSVSHVGSKYS